MVRRILIKGGCGAGKTTLAFELARRLDLPHLELDALHHGPNWTAASAAELRAGVQAQLDDARGWVVDGNYDSKLGTLLLERAELIVWLDLPLSVKLTRLLRRSGDRWLREAELWNGNRETLRGLLWGAEALFPWAVRTHFKHRHAFPELFARRPSVRLRDAQEVRSWLADFCRREAAPASPTEGTRLAR